MFILFVNIRRESKLKSSPIDLKYKRLLSLLGKRKSVFGGCEYKSPTQKPNNLI